MALKLLGSCKGGSGATFQTLPFHRSMSDWPLADPTAQTLFVARASTALKLENPVWVGVETTLQAAPFQCSASTCGELMSGPVFPMAQTSFAAAPPTAPSKF